VDWIFEYNQVRNPDANINYQSIGSGGGIRQFLEQTVDFGASERYLRPEQLVGVAGTDPSRLPWAAQMIGLSRRIERYADHGVDIAEQAVFAITGVTVELLGNDPR
jgi:hypothetical protein